MPCLACPVLWVWLQSTLKTPPSNMRLASIGPSSPRGLAQGSILGVFQGATEKGEDTRRILLPWSHASRWLILGLSLPIFKMWALESLWGHQPPYVHSLLVKVGPLSRSESREQLQRQPETGEGSAQLSSQGARVRVRAHPWEKEWQYVAGERSLGGAGTQCDPVQVFIGARYSSSGISFYRGCQWVEERTSGRPSWQSYHDGKGGRGSNVFSSNNDQWDFFVCVHMCMWERVCARVWVCVRLWILLLHLWFPCSPLSYLLPYISSYFFFIPYNFFFILACSLGSKYFLFKK